MEAPFECSGALIGPTFLLDLRTTMEHSQEEVVGENGGVSSTSYDYRARSITGLGSVSGSDFSQDAPVATENAL